MDHNCPKCKKRTSAVCADCGGAVRDIICYTCYGASRLCSVCRAKITDIPKDALYQD